MKTETLVCPNCSAEYTHWLGQCTRCKYWFEDQPTSNKQTTLPKKLKDITTSQVDRYITNWEQIDRVMGGGIVKDSLTLIAGSPGIGKSTLLLQLSDVFSALGKTVLYVSAEESLDQVKLRAKRLGVNQENIYLSNEERLSEITKHVDHIKPDLLVLDSAQLIYDDRIKAVRGGPTQVKSVAQECMVFAKQKKIATILIGHITKDGDIAGPRLLEHLVDTVIEFEGDRKLGIRLLRSIKNRFGAADEVALFEMKEKGLKPIENPSQFFVENHDPNLYGISVTPTIEGRRSFLVEAQILTAKSAFPNPTRKFSCIDANRMHMLLAVLDQKYGYAIHGQDVYASLVGGIKITEPAIDLALLIAAASAYRGKPVSSGLVSIGEVGLSGEVRPVSFCQTRVKEAIRMGIKRIILPIKNYKDLPDKTKEKAQFHPVQEVGSALDLSVPRSSM